MAELVFWQQSVPDLLMRLNSSAAGLTSSEAADRLKQAGPNILRPPRKRALVLQFLARFKNPLVIILLVASAVSAFTGDVTSFLIISAIVIMSVTLDFIQEHRAGKAAEKLRQSVAIRVQALRDGKSVEIPAATLVPGDVVSLAAGDLVPGDGRVLVAQDFFVMQALLTGESYPVEKFTRDLPDAGQDMADAVNSVFMGTSVVSGS
ncbi:MAG: cation-transporting P-type ATPase, partial [Nitrospirota bacterium]